MKKNNPNFTFTQYEELNWLAIIAFCYILLVLFFRSVRPESHIYNWSYVEYMHFDQKGEK